MRLLFLTGINKAIIPGIVERINEPTNPNDKSCLGTICIAMIIKTIKFIMKVNENLISHEGLFTSS